MSSTATRQAPAASPPVEWRQAEAAAERWPMLVERREATWARDSGKWDQVRYAGIDFLLLCLGNLAAYYARLAFANAVHGASRGLGGGLQASEGLLLLHAALGVMACVAFEVYHPERHRSAGQKLFAIAKSIASATLLLAGFALLAAQHEVSLAMLAAALPLDIGLLAGWRFAVRSRVRQRVRRGEGLSRVLIVGAGRTGKALASCLQANPQLGYTVCGFLDNHANGDARLLGPVQDFRRIALAQFADQVFVTASGERELVKSIFVEARRLRMNLSVVPELYDGLGWSAPLESIGGFPVMRLHAQPIPAFGLAIKRGMDLAGAICGLLVSAPLLLLAAVWIRMDSAGPVFYTAARVGRKGRKFHCYKLRTMTAEADGKKQELRSRNERHGPFFKMENDPRLTRSGKWLRRLSIDELPQLLNVLLGDMSMVGPRPHPVDDFELYSVEHLRRLDVKPGVTGLWQVSARTDPSFETSMALDLEYIETWSLRADLRILRKTIPVVFRAEGS